MASAESQSGISGLSVVDAWQLEDVHADVHVEAYKKAVRDGMNRVCKEHGGPENYLRVRFQTQQDLNEWMNYLIHLVPLDCSEFNFSADLPTTKMDETKKEGFKQNHDEP